jgi:hypothetical protein
LVLVVPVKTLATNLVIMEVIQPSEVLQLKVEVEGEVKEQVVLVVEPVEVDQVTEADLVDLVFLVKDSTVDLV